MNIIIMSILAGVCGTGLGGILTAFFGSRKDNMTSILLSFAGGVMTSIVFFELIPESNKLSNTRTTILGLVAGVIMVLVLNEFLDAITDAGKKKSKLHETYKEFYHESAIIKREKNMIHSGFLMFFAIALHNIPEGLAIGTAGYHNAKLGVTLALMIAIHNIPEGMAISAPLISGGVNRGKVILLTLLAGAPTILGAFAGVLIGSVSDNAVALSFSIAGGAMLYVVFGEILPQSVTMRQDRAPTIILLVGIVLGLLLTKI